MMKGNETMTIADVLFLSRAMGAPVPGGADPAKWCGAALANPERRAAAHAHIEALIGQLPTEEDAARTPVEAEKPAPQAIRHLPQSVCACESGKAFADCHGADDYYAKPIAANAGNAQNAAGEEFS